MFILFVNFTCNCFVFVEKSAFEAILSFLLTAQHFKGFHDKT